MWWPDYDQDDLSQSSFVRPVLAPVAQPGSAPLVTLGVNAAWIPYLLGCAMQLVQPQVWEVATPAALADLQQQATDLIAILANAEAAPSSLHPIANSNPLAPLIFNSAGRLILTGGA